MKEAILAMNAEIQGFIAPMLPSRPAGVTLDAGWAEWQATYSAAWREAMGKTDHIRIKHGFVRCEDAPGWRYAGAA